MTITIMAERPYSSWPKISKPKELRGIKPFASHTARLYNGRVSLTSHGFIRHPDVWIKLNGWFAGFAWIKVKNALEHERVTDLLRQITHDTMISKKSRFNHEDCRTITDLCVKAWTMVKRGECKHEQGNES